MNQKKVPRLDDLPEVGLRAAWHETEADWRSFLLSTSAPGWNVGWLRLVLDEKATKLALKFFYHPDGFVLPPDATPAELFEAAAECAIDMGQPDEQPAFGPN